MTKKVLLKPTQNYRLTKQTYKQVKNSRFFKEHFRAKTGAESIQRISIKRI